MLNSIKGAKQVGNCASPLYQKSMIRSTATYGGSGLVSVPGIDVTCLSTFTSTRPEVASIEGTVVTGLSEGNTTIGFDTTAYGSDLVATASLMVLGTEVTITRLETTLPNRALWSAFVSPDSLISQDYTARVTIEQSIKFDGDGGPVYTQAIFSDGKYQYIKPGRAWQLLLTTPSTRILDPHCWS